MAAVMMRAFAGGSSKSSHQTASSSNDALDGESLSRQSSRLSPPNPAYTIGSPMGILIK
jgi:hypothetical protein